MNSRERLLKAVRLEKIDRVPISSYEMVGWNKDDWYNVQPSYQKVMDVIREKTDCIYWFLGQSEIRECFKPVIEEWYEGDSKLTKSTYDVGGKKINKLQRLDKGINTIWTLEHLLKDIEDIDTYLKIPYETPKITLDKFYKEQEKLGSKGIMMLDIYDPICNGADLFSMGDFLMHAVLEEDKISYFLDALNERILDELDALLKYDLKDVMFRIVGPEYATPPYMSPKQFEKFVGKYLGPIVDKIKGAGGIARLHSHSNIGKVIDQMVDSGIEALDPIEAPPHGDITLGEVKKLYGDKICLMGNIELVDLESLEKEEIDQIVKKSMEEAKGESGYIILPTAAPLNAPLSPKTEENYIQFIESSLIHGKY